MLAIDHRESLRTMLAAATGLHVGDQQLSTFKTSVVQALAGSASAVLIDGRYGMAAIDHRPAGTPLVLAADSFVQEAGGPIRTSTLDESIDAGYVAEVGAAALKLLVIWRRGEDAERRAEMVGRFLRLCADCGVASLVEGIARPDPGASWRSSAEHHEAILAAAQELCAARPDVYKAEVPGYRPGDLSAVTAQSEQLDRLVVTTWVVLSNGVRCADFRDAVSAACRGGASGFVAGRAIWSDIVGAEDVDGALHRVCLPRLRGYRDAARRPQRDR